MKLVPRAGNAGDRGILVRMRFEGAGSASLGLNLPPITDYVGLSFYTQWLVLDPSAINGVLSATGGIRSIADAESVLNKGADKISINSPALEKPALISELAFQTGGLGQLHGASADHAGFLFRNLGISAIMSALVLRYLYVQHQWRQQIQAEAQARVQALQARIRPHFLFNSMNSIAALTRSDPLRAEQALQDLSDLFRVSLQEASERVTLDDEISVAERYLRMEALRLGNRLSVDWDIERLPRKRWVPSLILQPLLENAIYHGIEPSPLGGRIRITGWAEGKRITIKIINPRAPALADAHRKGNQIALENIRLRLQLAFGEQAGVALSEIGDQFETTLYFPREKMQ